MPVVLPRHGRRSPWPRGNARTGFERSVLSQDPPQRLPFDWRHIPVLRYTTDGGLGSMIEALAGKLRHAILEIDRDSGRPGRTG